MNHFSLKRILLASVMAAPALAPDSPAWARPRFRAVLIRDQGVDFNYGNASPGAYPQINEHNQIIFLNAFIDGKFTARYWENGRLYRLGNDTGYNWLSAYAINNQSEFSGDVVYNTDTGGVLITHPHPFRTFNKVVTELPLDPGAHQFDSACYPSRATDLNDLGVAAGWVRRPITRGYQLDYPVVWSFGGITDIGPLNPHPPDSQFSPAPYVVINNSGTIAGVYFVNYSGCQSCYLGYYGQPGAISQVSPFPGGKAVGIWDINNLGVLAGSSDGIFGGSYVADHAMLVENGSKKDIHGSVYPVTQRSRAFAVNDSGAAVGLFQNLRGLYYDNDTTWLLDSLVVNNATFPDMYEAFDINNRGFVVALCGWPSGTPRPCLLVPVDSIWYVNTTNDLPDQNPNDGRCFTGNMTPFGEEECSFRAAIQHTNATAGPDTIRFKINVGGVPTIRVNSALPPVTERVLIDATTQPNIERVEVRPTDSTVPGDGLVISAGPSTVRGLLLNGFSGSGLVLNANNTKVERCFLGIGIDSVSRAGNYQHGIRIASDSNKVGNGFDDEANLIAFNQGAGIFVQSGKANVFLRNIYHDNGGLGIDLAPLGVNLNDTLDSDGGANARVNYPYVDSMTTSAGQTTLYGTLVAEPLVSYVVEISKSDACDSSGYGEGREAVWSTVASTNLAGVAQFATLFNGVLDSGEVYTLTATDTAKSTSEFSPCWPLKCICLEDGQRIAIRQKSFALSSVAHDPPTFTESLVDTVTTDDEGCIDLKPFYEAGLLRAGDSIKVSRTLDSIPRYKGMLYLRNAATVYLDNGKFDSINSDYYYDDLDRTPRQTVAVTHTTVGVNLLACTQWNSDSAYIGALGEGFRGLANYLYDVSDGQLTLDTVVLSNQPIFWHQADLRVFASNVRWPSSYTGGLFDGDEDGHAYMEIGRRWFGLKAGGQADMSAQEWPMRPQDEVHYRSIGHELGHYALCFKDEYPPSDAERCAPGHYFGFMDKQYPQFEPSASEMSWGRQYESVACQNTDQWLIRGESCWDGFVRQFQRTYGGVWAEILRPDERNIPGDLDHLYGPNEATLQVDVGGRLSVQNLLFPRTSRDMITRIHTRNNTGLAGLDVETWSAENGRTLFQGQTSSDGEIWLLDVAPGDSLFAASGRLRAVIGAQLAAAADSDYVWHSAAMELSAVGDSLALEAQETYGYLPALVSLEAGATGTPLHLLTARPFSATPELTFRPDPDSGAASTLTFAAVAGGYDVTLPIDSSYQGGALVRARDDSSRPFYFGVDLVSENVTAAEGPLEISAAGSTATLRIDSVTGAGRVAFVTSRYLPLRYGLPPEAAQAGPALAYGTHPGGLTAGATLLELGYHDHDLVGVQPPFNNEATLQVFVWDVGTSLWEVVGGTVDTAADRITATVPGPGIYAAFSTGQLTAVGDPPAALVVPRLYELAQNHPNPFNPSTTISYYLPRAGRVTLRIHNVLGQTVRTLVDEVRSAGAHDVIWDGRNHSGKEVGSGVYFYTLRSEEGRLTRRMVLLR